MQSFLLPEQPGWEGSGEAIVESQIFKIPPCHGRNKNAVAKNRRYVL